MSTKYGSSRLERLLAHLVDVRGTRSTIVALEDAVHARVRAELVVAADQLPAQD